MSKIPDPEVIETVSNLYGQRDAIKHLQHASIQ
jgi:hypothetical protein